uniref:Uncharacterized protein n=1 Tax=Glossina austeni TaxID=7395 RepID=A0A1A9VIJ1_GLOAU
MPILVAGLTISAYEFFFNWLPMKPLVAIVLVVTMISLPPIARVAVSVGLGDLILSVVVKILAVNTIIFDVTAVFSVSPFVPDVGFGDFDWLRFTYNSTAVREEYSICSIVVEAANISF